MARHMHVHLYAFPTRDAAEITAADYEQLAEELLAFIASKEAGTQDEWKEEEHPRQPDGKFGQGGGSAVKPEEKPAAGLGPKPTSTQAKVAKHAVHELLSSGHPWSIDELAAITGHANKTSLSSWISMFKNAKTAGPKGQLSIVKLPNGQYQVVKQDGQPAPKVDVPKPAPGATPAPKAAPAPKPKPAPPPVVPKPAPAPVPAPPPAASTAPVATMGPGTVTLPKVTVGVSARDFEEVTGPAGSKFGQQMTKLSSAMSSGVTAGGDYKKIIKAEVEAGLQKHLKSSKAFQAFKKVHEQFGAQKAYSPERILISNWASSSGDHNSISCAMQLAIRDAFNLKDTEIGGMGLLAGKGKEGERDVWTDAAKNFGYKMNTPEREAIFKEALRDFAKAQYNQTQEWFKAKGITEICVVRGMKTKGPDKPKQVSMGLQPASSFSAQVGTAKNFAGAVNATMLAAKIPVSHVLSTYRTGYGCANEHEVVVLGDRSLTAVASSNIQADNKLKLAAAGRSAFEKSAVTA